jgi:UrcA family protein
MMQFRPFILAAAVLAAGLTTLTATAPAFASESSVTVAHGDLNLNSAAGRAVLDARIERAARQICGTAFINELDIAAGVAACRRDVIAAARAQRDALVGGER